MSHVDFHQQWRFFNNEDKNSHDRPVFHDIIKLRLLFSLFVIDRPLTAENTYCVFKLCGRPLSHLNISTICVDKVISSKDTSSVYVTSLNLPSHTTGIITWDEEFTICLECTQSTTNENPG